MKAKVKVTLKNNIPKFIARLQGSKLQKYTKLSGKIVKENIQHMLSGPGAGIPYWDYDLEDWHQPSLPGDPPAFRTGELHDSWKIQYENSVNSSSVYVGSDLGYASSLQYGNRRLEARPYMDDAVERSVPAIQALLQNLWRDIAK